MYETVLTPGPLTPVHLLLDFFAYAFIGWIWESLYVSIKNRKLTSSGFVFGPVIPIYGISIMTVLLLLGPFTGNLGALFAMGVLLITLIEYVTSWLMEIIFHARWWDYSKVPLNFQGRVALPVSLFWGIGVVAIVKLLDPFISAMILGIPATPAILLATVFTGIFMFDLGFTVANALSLGAATKRLEESIETTKAAFVDKAGDTAAQAAHVVAQIPRPEWLNRLTHDPDELHRLSPLNLGQRRLLASFPTLKIRNITTPLKDIRDLSTELRRVRRRQRKLRKAQKK